MAKILLNFANRYFYQSQRFNSQTGLSLGGFDKVVSYSHKDIDREFFKQNSRILSQSKGAGYWLWKPYFIVKTLDLLKTGDFLFYCDSGAHFIKSIEPLVNTCQSLEQDIIPFDVGLAEKTYTKRDAFILMGCDTQSYTDTTQRLGSFILLKKSKFTVDFTREYLQFAGDERILTDMENQMGRPNYPGFEAHRHDQSIFSLLTKKYDLPAHRDPSQWGNGGEQDYPHSRYGQLINHTRAKESRVSLALTKAAQEVFHYLGSDESPETTSKKVALINEPTKPKVIFVTPVFPNTTGFGLAMRAGALLEALSTNFHVYLLIVPVYDPQRKNLPKNMLSFCTQYKIVPVSNLDRIKAQLKDMGSRFRRRAVIPQVSLFNSARLRRAAEEAFGRIDFDLLYVFRLYLAPVVSGYLSQTSLKKRWLDLDDIESQTRSGIAARLRANGLVVQARQEEHAAGLYADYERLYLPLFDGISVCSTKDQAHISRLLPDRTISVLPNIVRPNIVSLSSNNSGTFEMLFVGNLNYYPNSDALDFFIGEILPQLRSLASRPLSFTIIGSGKWLGRHQSQNTADCHYAGFVPDVSSYYEKTDAVVVPLRTGGGTRIKVLEAFSFRRPVITTSIGAEGIEVEHDKHVLIANGPENFAKQCCRIMENPKLCATLTGNASARLEQKYTLPVLSRRLKRMLD